MSDPRAALEAIGLLPDTEIDIGDAALQLARIDAPDADWHAAREHLSALARDAVELAGMIDTNDLSMRAEALAGLIAGRYTYAGDAETYDDLANANLINVIHRRRGLPVALGIVWLHTARAAGWGAHGDSNSVSSFSQRRDFRRACGCQRCLFHRRTSHRNLLASRCSS